MLRTLLGFLFAASALQAEPIRIACGSCYKPHKDDAIWATIAQDEPAAFLFMGDNIYGDTEDMKLLRKRYRALTELPGFINFQKSVPVHPVWDDHDYGKNDAGRDYPKRVASQKVFLNAFNFPARHPARKQQGIYHSTTIGAPGKEIHLIMLDTRYHRSELRLKKGVRKKTYLPLTTSTATILGKKQWDWLEAELQKPARLRIIVTSIQAIMTDHRFEKWSNIPAERERLIRALEKAGPTILLSGDRHLAEVCRLKKSDSSLDYDLYELTSSGMTHADSSFYPSNLRVEGTHYRGKNYGLVEVDWPEVSLIIKSNKGDEKSRTKITF